MVQTAASQAEPENGAVLQAQPPEKGQVAPRSGRSLWQGVRTAVHFSNAFQTLRAMSAEAIIDPAQLVTIKRLGEGAFATVDLCWYTPSSGEQKQQVAVKRMKPEIFAQPADLAAFIREADLLRKIRHSYIVEYIGVGAMDISTPDSVQASTYLVQEYLAAGTLKRMVFRRQLASHRSSAYRLQDALRWCTQVARALRYLHSAKPMIIHRDLKLENVLLHGATPAAMVAKVADFGLCACVDSWISQRRAVESDNLALVGSLQFINSGVSNAAHAAPAPPVLPATPEKAEAGPNPAPDAEADDDGFSEPLASPFVAAPAPGGTAPAAANGSLKPAAGQAGALDTVDGPVLQLQPSTPLEFPPKQQQSGPLPRHSSLKRMLTGFRNSHKQAQPERTSTSSTETFRLSGHTGSLLYMAPEVYLLQEYNHMVDVFSFAVVMLELFSGRVVSTVVAPNGFFSEIDAYAHRVAREAYRPPIPADVPAPISQLIQRCWAQKAEERPDMDQVVKALQEIDASGAVQAADAAEPTPACSCFG